MFSASAPLYFDLDKISTMLSQSEIDAFISNQMSKSTKMKTGSDLNIFLKWVRKSKNEFSIEDIEKLDPKELKAMLSSFVLAVKKDNGEEYVNPDFMNFGNTNYVIKRSSIP